MPGRWGAALALVAAAVLLPRAVRAQNVSLTLTGGPLTFPTPTGTDFQNGFIDTPTGLSYTINQARTAFSHTSTLTIRATSANLGNGKPLSDLLWRRADLGTWTPLTTSDATVESQSGKVTYTNSILFRTLLSWTGTVPATYGANIVLTMTVTTP